MTIEDTRAAVERACARLIRIGIASDRAWRGSGRANRLARLYFKQADKVLELKRKLRDEIGKRV